MSEEEQNSSTSKHRILILDDDENSQHELSSLIKKKFPNIEIEFTNNGLTALKKLLDGHYNLIITDLLMPIMSGEDFIEVLIGAGIKLPIIILTCIPLTSPILIKYPSFLKPQIFETPQVVKILSKPPKSDLLFESINKVLETQKKESCQVKISLSQKEKIENAIKSW